MAINFEKKNEVRNFIKQVAKSQVINGLPYCQYELGWSDERIAAAMGLPLDTIRNQRAKTMGSLRVPRPKPEPVQPVRHLAGNGVGKIESLEARMKRLEELNGELEKRIVALEDHITSPRDTRFRAAFPVKEVFRDGDRYK